MTQAPARPAVRRQVLPVYAAGFVTAFGAHAVAANLGRYALGHHGSLWELGLLLAAATAALSAGVGFLPVLAGQHHLGPIAAGALVSLLAAAAAVLQPVTGRRIDDGRLPPAAAAALAACAGGFLIAITGLPGLIAGAILIGAGVATATPAGFARLAASTPPGQLGRTMGAAEAGREIGDAGGPVLVGAFGLISLTAGLGALAATLMVCAALAAPRNRARPSHPRPASHEHRPTPPFAQTRGETRSR